MNTAKLSPETEHTIQVTLESFLHTILQVQEVHPELENCSWHFSPDACFVSLEHKPVQHFQVNGRLGATLSRLPPSEHVILYSIS